MTLQEALSRALEIPPKKEEISGIIEERNNFVFSKKQCLYKKPKIALHGFFDPKEKNGSVKIIKKAKEKNMIKTTCQYKILEMISQLKSMATKEVLEMLPEFKSSTVMTTLSKFPSTMLSRTKSGGKNGRKTIYTYVGSGDIIKETNEYSKLISLKRTKKKSLLPKIIKNKHIEPKKEVEVLSPKPDNDLILKMMQEISELKNYIMSFEISVKQQEVKMIKILKNLIIKNKNISDDELEILKM